MRKLFLVVVGLGVFLAAQSALAVPVTFGDGGTALQGVLDDITTDPLGSSSVDVVNDDIGNYPAWALTASGGTIATFIIEIAGFAGGNTFGVADASNPTLAAERATIFTGLDTAGDSSLLQLKADGSVLVNFVDTGVNFAGNRFLFFLDSSMFAGGGLFFSDPNLNVDGLDHMFAYRGVNDFVQLPNQFPGKWTPGEYILAWEDQNEGGDLDYTDMVLMVESVQPVPEGSSVALWCMVGGVFAVGCWFRRKRRIPR